MEGNYFSVKILNDWQRVWNGKAMPSRITVSTIFIFCFVVVGHKTKILHCFISLAVVMWVSLFFTVVRGLG